MTEQELSLAREEEHKDCVEIKIEFEDDIYIKKISRIFSDLSCTNNLSICCRSSFFDDDGDGDDIITENLINWSQSETLS